MARSVMKILVLDEEFPYPLNTGKRTRSFNLYRRLATRFQIRYVAYGDGGSIAANGVRVAGIEPIAVPAEIAPKQGAAFYFRLLGNLFSPLPYIVTSHYSKIYASITRSQLAEFQPDLLLCEWTPYAVYAKGITGVIKAVSAHNVEADIWRRYYQTEKNRARRWYIGEQWRKVQRFERTALSWVDGAISVSAADRTQLQQSRPELPIGVIPNGVDLDYFSPTEQPSSRQHLVFTGSMDWRPNQEAARYFVSRIFPLLRQELPQVECTFAGRDPPPHIRALAQVPGIRITGTVDDVRPYIERAAVYVVPLQIGGGSRLKILEALAMGRPVVSTSVGAEGLELANQRHLVLADDPVAFANAVLRLLQDPARCLDLSSAGRRLVEQKYGWDSIAEKLEGFIRELSSRPAPSHRRESAAMSNAYR
jgi:polysaccharide biosynthesis protein PslH